MRGLILLLLALSTVAGPARAAALDVPATVAALQAKGDAAIAAYAPAGKAATADALSDLYFDSFEGSGLEAAIGAVDDTAKTALEARFGRLIGTVRKGPPPAAVRAEWAPLRADLAALPARLGATGSHGGFWATAAESFLILLREGFEAMLVITALATSLRRAGAGHRVKVVYHGVGWALAASLATAWALSALVQGSGQGQEIMEGGTMLLASAVLFYCSYWLFAKREAARWQAYVRQQVDQALSGGRLFALGFAAFLAVYREGAETALFYQALAAGAPGQMTALLAGLVAAAAALAALFVAMRTLSLRLPLGVFFTVTAGLLYYLAVTFAGDGIVELQNGKALPITPLHGWPSLGWIGLFPTAEGVAAQAVLVAALLLALAVWGLRRQARRAA